MKSWKKKALAVAAVLIPGVALASTYAADAGWCGFCPF